MTPANDSIVTPVILIIAIVVITVLRGLLINLLIMANNKFNYMRIDTSDKHRIDCSNKSPLWMHNVERTDTNNKSNIFISFGIMLAFAGFVICLFIAVDTYPNAYPKKPIVKIYSKK